MEKKTKDKVTGIRFPPEMLATLDAMAKADGRSLSNMVIKLIQEALDAQGPRAKV